MLQKLKNMIGTRSPVRIGYHTIKAFFAALLYGFPARKLTVIGVTGTDGKTTTVGMIAHILHEQSIAVGALSTAFFRIREDVTWNETRLTSPSPFVVQKFLSRLVKEGCTHAVLEYSSHGLVQHRSDWTFPAIAAITNLSLEHLDYHGTMEQYQEDKKRLFLLLDDSGTKVLNRDDVTYDDYRHVASRQTWTYGVEPPQESVPGTHLWLTDVRGNRTSCSTHVRCDAIGQPFPLHLNVPGLFNLENALCAICSTGAAGIDPQDAAATLATFTAAPGRMELINAGQDFAVYIDFTVSPNAFEKTLGALRASMEKEKRLLVLTGSCGDRMREKRPLIAEICSNLADTVVITDDESYEEDPLMIIEEVWQGIDQQHVDAHKIPDRREALRHILLQAQSGDTVLLCGMGSYPFRQTVQGKIPWNEQEIVREILDTLLRDAADNANNMPGRSG